MTEKQFAFESSLLWRIKLRLQFTGWLQYVPNAFAVLVCFLLSFLATSLTWLCPLPLAIVAHFFAYAGCMLGFVLVFDVLTVKFQIHPPEQCPKKPSNGPLTAFDVMRMRRYCRSFQSRQLTDSDREKILDCARAQCIPSARLGAKPVRLEYIAAPLSVFPTNVPNGEFLVALAPKEYDCMAVVDVGRSLQKVVLHATRIGVATCWIGPGANHESVISHLGPERFDVGEDHVICVCALGYRSLYCPLAIRVMNLVSRKRLPLRSLFFADERFTEPLEDVTRPPFDDFGRCFEGCRFSPSSFNAQTTRCVAVTGTFNEDVDGGGRERPVVKRFDFYSANPHSRYYAVVALGIWLADWEVGCQELDIKGHFAVLAEEERTKGKGREGTVHNGLTKISEGKEESLIPCENLPQYYISWVRDQPKAQHD